MAAGASTRLGQPKQLVRLRGRSLIERSVRLAQEVSPNRVVVVIGADHLRVRRHLYAKSLRPRIVRSPNWRQGMSTSLKDGLQALPASAHGLLVLLCDQPAIAACDIGRLVRAWRQRPAAPTAAAFSGRIGAPAIFPRRFFRNLQSLAGDKGARDLLRSNAQTSTVQMPAAAIDVDTPADRRALSRLSLSRSRWRNSPSR